MTGRRACGGPPNACASPMKSIFEMTIVAFFYINEQDIQSSS